jgi:hypothetical protein
MFPNLSYISPFIKLSFQESRAQERDNKQRKMPLHEYVDSTVKSYQFRSARLCSPELSKERTHISVISYPIPKIKLAFLSAFWYTHSVGLLMKSVILGISRTLYEIVIISTHSSIFIENDVDFGHELNPGIPVSQNGRYLPPTKSRRIIKGDSLTAEIFNSADELHIFTFDNLKIMQVTWHMLANAYIDYVIFI